MSELLKHVDQTIRTHRLLQHGQSILVAVSGGLDSMVLLHVLQELSTQHAWHLAVAHLNHRLRGRSSDADERLVRRTAEALALPLTVRAADVSGHARKHKLSIEMAARKLRHDFLADVALQKGIRTIGVAHHADDQLELFFLRLLRGSSGEGLTGMKWSSKSPGNPQVNLVRPLLDLPKSALATYALERKIRFREDATNTLLDFQRNRIRHELLPLLKNKYQPALDTIIPRVMDIIGAEADFITQTAKDWLQNKTPAPFDQLPVAIQRRSIQIQLLTHGVTADYELIEQLRTCVSCPVSVGADKVVVRTPSGHVHLQESGLPKFKTTSKNLALADRAGEATFDGVSIHWNFDREKLVRPPEPVAGQEIFDAQKVGNTIVLRHWRPGDRFHPIGMEKPLKLQDFFTNQKVLRTRRHQLIVATNARNELFWVEGLRISDRFKLTKATKRRLLWRWKRL